MSSSLELEFKRVVANGHCLIVVLTWTWHTLNIDGDWVIRVVNFLVCSVRGPKRIKVSLCDTDPFLWISNVEVRH